MGAEYLELKAPDKGYEIPNLPQLKDQEIWYAYEAQGNLIHSETYREYNKAFYEAMIGGINIEADFDAFKNTDYWEKYMLNTFQFSAAKSAAEMKMLQGYVFGKNGERVPFEQFKEVVEPIVGQFKEQWLRVEYDLAVHGAVMGQRWNDLYRDRDLFPYWVFTTRKDDRVRKHHEELEGKIFKFDDPYAQQFWPPLDWNCRCEGESTDEGTPLNKNEMEKYVDDIGKGFEGNVGIDGIFPKTKSASSYFSVLPNANKAKPEMFKEKPVSKRETIYDKINKIEKEIRNNKFETMVVVDKKGNEILNLKGDKDSVKADQKDIEKITKGSIITHNHPSALNFPEKSMRRIGQSFSTNDIMTASKFDTKEMRAVTPNYTFIMKPGKNGWPSGAKITKTYNEIHEKLRIDLSNRIEKGITTINKAQTIHWHTVNKMAAEKLGMKYTKIRNNE